MSRWRERFELVRACAVLGIIFVIGPLLLLIGMAVAAVFEWIEKRMERKA